VNSSASSRRCALGNEAATNTYGVTVRHAYATWNRWLAGQTWSNFQDVAALPDAVEFIAEAVLAGRAVPYTNEEAPAGTVASVRVGGQTIESFVGTGLSAEDLRASSTEFTQRLTAAVVAAGYPEKADDAQINKPMVLLLLTLLVLYVTMVYGPIAAWLVEMFPTRIRYTSMSLPYHIGNGWFGGFLPTTAFALVALTGNIYYGLWYPVIIALATVVIGALFLRETKDVDITR
jgi:hypothetical protein